MPRPKIVAGNWKMFTTSATARALAAGVAAGVKEGGPRVVVCPPFPWLTTAADAIQGSAVKLGSQDIYPGTEGAFTGEVSGAMLADAGCSHVIVGHSERRHVLGETDALIARKVAAGLAAGLTVILCVGETLEERQAASTHAVLDSHITHGLAGVKAEQLTNIVVAYEPVWAIGTGHTATPDQAQEAHAFLRQRLGQLYSPAAAAALPILYGGSVNPGNAASLFAQPDVDGGLIGGASLKPDSFLAIVAAAG